LSRTPTEAGNRKTWTWSGWVKRGNLDNWTTIFGSWIDGSNKTRFKLDDNNWRIFFDNEISNASTQRFYTTRVLNDSSKWYHLVLSVDTTQTTSSNRVKIYINSEQVTTFDQSDYPVQNLEYYINTTNTHRIGKPITGGDYLDGYLSDINFIDWQALTPTSFGETVWWEWIPKDYTWTYWTNWFNLDFGNENALWADTSGNGNNWTVNNIDSTDQMLDSPSNNFATWNPLDKAGSLTISEGNLKIENGASYSWIRSTIKLPKIWKWYAEYREDSSRGANVIGEFGLLESNKWSVGDNWWWDWENHHWYWGLSWGYIKWYNTNFITNNSSSWWIFPAIGSGDILQVAIDRDLNKVWFWINNVWYTVNSSWVLDTNSNPWNSTNPVSSLDSNKDYSFWINHRTSHGIANFGQWGQTGLTYYPESGGKFKYQPPTGFKALSSANIPETKTVNCTETWAPENSTYTVVQETIASEQTPSECAWTCNSNFHEEAWICTSNTKTVSCSQTWAPANTTYIVVDETVTYDGTSWSTPTTCDWNCNTWTLASGDSCATSKVIANSLRFNDDDSAYLSRTPSVAGDRKTWTWSWWVKRGNLDNLPPLFTIETNPGYAYTELRFNSTSNKLRFHQELNSSTTYAWVNTDASFSDPSAWYHIVVKHDTTQSILDNRIKIYVNWVDQSLTWDAEIWQNRDSDMWSNVIHYLWWWDPILSWRFFDGYMSNINFIDWQALTADDFGWFDSETGQWKAKEYSGSYGTNWFNLEFGDENNVGKDTSGKGNDWAAWITDTVKSLTVTWNAKHSTTASKIGSSSIYLDGLWDNITTQSNADLSFWTWDFTIEFWTKQAVSQTSSHKYMIMWAQDSSFWIATKNYKLWLWVDDNWSWWHIFNWIEWTTPLNDDIWHHIAVVRNGTSYKGYVDWVAEIILTLPSATTSVFGDKIWIWAFANKDVVHPITGYMDEIRISNTARYTSNFTPQTTPFTTDANTKLLIHSDTTNGSTTFTDSSPVVNPNASDQMLDSPSNNFATLNPLFHELAKWKPTFSDGNLKINSSGKYATISSIWTYINQKSYYELSINTPDYVIYFTDWEGNNIMDWVSNIYNYPWNWTYPSSWTNYWNSVLWIAVDYQNSVIQLYKDWILQSGNVLNMDISYNWPIFVKPRNPWTSNNQEIVANFGQWWQTWLQDCAAAGGKFKYCPPTGFKAISTNNLPIPTIKDPSEHFDVLTYTGNWGSQSVGWLGFKPDFVWLKDRTRAERHILCDSVRWNWNMLTTIDSRAEETGRTDMIWSIDSNWFTVWNAWPTNFSWDNFVAWNWKAGWTAVTNTEWSITSQVSANVDAGFSIVGYTGNYSAWQTVWHWLWKKPELIIVKNRDDLTRPWVVDSEYTDFRMLLNTSDAQASPYKHTDLFNNLTFSLENWTTANWNNNHIAYAFHSVPWYSKVWSYTGNGSADGPFVYTGFKPRYVMIKRTDNTGSWWIQDTIRESYNPSNNWLLANDSRNEHIDNSLLDIDFLSNWFKIKNSYASRNFSWWKYIYIAFAEAPFKYANAR
jgi:hypothetical protein